MHLHRYFITDGLGGDQTSVIEYILVVNGNAGRYGQHNKYSPR